MKKVTQKFLAMGLVMLMCIGCFSAFTVSAEDTPFNVELLTNGDFELKDESDSSPVGWTIGKTPSNAGGTVMVRDEMLRIKATNATTDGSSWAYQKYSYVKPTRGMTVISGKIYIEELSNGSYVKIDSNRNGFAPQNTMGAMVTYTEPKKEWVSFESTITDTSPADSYMFYIRLYGTGLVWVDDVSIQNKDRLLPTPWESMSWNIKATEEGVAEDFGYITNDELKAAGEEFKAFSGDSCFFIKKTANKTTRPMYKFTAATTPVVGANYRISCRFRPLVETQEINGPKIHIGTSNDANRFPKNWSGTSFIAIPGTWTVGNEINGWYELTTYFTMTNPDNHTYVRLAIWNTYQGYIDDLVIERDYEETARILNEDSKDITSAKAGETIKVKAHAIAEETMEKGGEKPAVILMRYTQEKGVRKCVDVKIVEKALAADGVTALPDGSITRNWEHAAEDIVLDYTIPADAAGSVIRAFAWNGADSLSPIGKADMITVVADTEAAN